MTFGSICVILSLLYSLLFEPCLRMQFRPDNLVKAESFPVKTAERVDADREYIQSSEINNKAQEFLEREYSRTALRQSRELLFGYYLRALIWKGERGEQELLEDDATKLIEIVIRNTPESERNDVRYEILSQLRNSPVGTKEVERYDEYRSNKDHIESLFTSVLFEKVDEYTAPDRFSDGVNEELDRIDEQIESVVVLFDGDGNYREFTDALSQARFALRELKGDDLTQVYAFDHIDKSGKNSEYGEMFTTRLAPIFESVMTALHRAHIPEHVASRKQRLGDNYDTDEQGQTLDSVLRFFTARYNSLRGVKSEQQWEWFRDLVKQTQETRTREYELATFEDLTNKLKDEYEVEEGKQTPNQSMLSSGQELEKRNQGQGNDDEGIVEIDNSDSRDHHSVEKAKKRIRNRKKKKKKKKEKRKAKGKIRKGKRGNQRQKIY